jgi:esterase/lipase superfamily enzyme
VKSIFWLAGKRIFSVTALGLVVLLSFPSAALADIDDIIWIPVSIIVAIFAGAGAGAGAVALRRREAAEARREAAEARREAAEARPPVQLARQANIYRVWYGTNRAEFVSGEYNNVFSPRIEYGVCEIYIPEHHNFGSLGSRGFGRWWTVAKYGSSDALSLQKTTPCDLPTFYKQINHELDYFREYERTSLIYIHGYNTSFKDAALRAAQIGFDLHIRGITAFFSWPSQGLIKSYFNDADMIAASEALIAEFIKTISNAIAGAKINIIAHSMGNLGLLRALTHATAKAELSGVRFGQIFLAAPDIDPNLFRRLASIYPSISERTTLYVSASDQALNLSGLVHENQRVGYTPPVTVVPGIDTVEATNVDIGLLGHGYYSSAAAVLYDMAFLIRHDASPSERMRMIKSATPEGHQYWVLRKST